MYPNERARIARELKEAAENINVIKNKGLDFDLDINEQFANELTEIERIIGWDSNQPETFVFTRLSELIEPTCRIKCIDTTPRGADECDMDWEWRCTNCNHNLSDKYDDLDIKTPEELNLYYCPNCSYRIIGVEQQI